VRAPAITDGAVVAGERRPPTAGRGDRRAGRVRRALVGLLARLHRWAESGHAGSAVCTWNALQGSVVPGPSEALLIPLGVADPPRAPRLALWAALGATAGGLIAYAIGLYAFDSVGRPLVSLLGVSDARWASLEGLFRRHGAMLVLLSTMSPLSTKFVCIGAGTFGVPFAPFVLALGAGRLGRFGLVGLLLRFAGARVLGWLERRIGRPIDAVH
jgi:membrane protein YqaA with SNARE-associated domain